MRARVVVKSRCRGCRRAVTSASISTDRPQKRALVTKRRSPLRNLQRSKFTLARHCCRRLSIFPLLNVSDAAVCADEATRKWTPFLCGAAAAHARDVFERDADGRDDNDDDDEKDAQRLVCECASPPQVPKQASFASSPHLRDRACADLCARRRRDGSQRRRHRRRCGCGCGCGCGCCSSPPPCSRCSRRASMLKKFDAAAATNGRL